MSHPSHLSSTRSKYYKFKSRLEKKISNGTFDSLSRRKKNTLISRVEKFRARLENMGISMKGAAVAGSVAAGAILPNISNAQSQGIYFRKTGTSIPFNAGTNDFVMANFDADPELEIIFSKNGGGEILNGDIDNGFTTATPAAFADMKKQVLVGDLDGDTYLDLIFTYDEDGTYIYKSINDGDGNFTTTYIGDAPFHNSEVDLVDWDSDGDLDVVATSGDNFFNVFVNDGDGNFSDYGSNIYLSTDNVISLEFADMDGDGDMDLVHLGEYDLGGPFDGQVVVRENTRNAPGVPVFAAPVVAYDRYSTAFECVEVLDMDGDGDLDIFFSDFGYTYVSRNEHQTAPFTFSSVNATTHSSSGAISDAVVSDFDNDGDDDLILVGGGYNRLFRFDGTDLSATNGYLGSQVGNVSQNLDLISLADIDGDGNLDLIGTNASSDYAYLDVSGVQKITIKPDDFTERRAVANVEIGALIAFNRDGNDIGDNDGGTVFTFATGDGTNDADNGRFVISGSGSTAKLEVGASDLDFETQSTYRILINTLVSGVNREFALELHLQNSPENGFGTFEATAGPVDDSRIYKPIIADIDGDGDNELIFKDDAGYSYILIQDDLTLSGGTPVATSRVFSLSDFDDDGDLDLIIGDGYDLKIYSNDGSGNFSYAFGQTISGYIFDVGVADFDCDGDKDFLTATDVGVYVEFNDNNERISGRNPVNYNNAQFVEVGDFNGDGQVDMVWGYNNDAYVNMNEGGASFSQTYSYSLGQIDEIKVADFDGDGDLDIFIAAGDYLYMLDGRGDGSFGYYYTEGYNIMDDSDVVVGDVDGDGLLDVTFVTDEGEGGDNIAVMLNDGSNYFSLKQALPVSEDEYASFRGLALGDVDGDDDLDIIVSSNNERQVLENKNIAPYIEGFSGRIIIDENTPVGTFLGQLSTDDKNGDGVASIAFADGENDNDFFVMDASGNITLNADLDWEEHGNVLSVEIEVEDDQGNSRVEDGKLVINNLPELGHGIFDPEPHRIFGSNDSRTFEPGDYDQDGDMDLFSSADYGPGLGIFQQNSASFSLESIDNFKYDANEAIFLDYDNDGDLDLLISDNGRLRIWRNNDGNFGDDELVGAGRYNNIGEILVGDFDGDGLLEVAITDELISNSDVIVFEINEDREFSHVQTLEIYDSGGGDLLGRTIEQKVLADFDGDGFDDLLIMTDGDDAIFYGSPSGLDEAYSIAITQNDYGVNYAQAGDLDGDGLPDIVSVRDSSDGTEKIIDIHVNDGDGSFDIVQSIGRAQLRALQLGDIDGDGSLDFVTSAYDDGSINYRIETHTNDGSGIFSLAQTIADADADEIELMDVDGDDDLDIVMRRTYREEVDDNVLFAFRNSNVAPTAINLSSTSFDEHLPEDTEVATITIDDLNLNDEHVISLVTGDGSNDEHNSFFYLVDNSLRLTKDVTYEDTPQLFILLSVYDGHQTYEQEVVFDINDVNVAPTAINLSSTSFDEGTIPGSIIATLSATDVNVGDDHYFELVTGDGTNDADNADFIVDGDNLIITVESQHEVKSSYNVYLAASDIDNTIEQAFVLTVNNVNEGPTGITLSATAFDEGTMPGTSIATIDAVDANAGDTHEFELVTGDGTNDADNGSFVIDGDQLVITEDSNFETKASYNIYLSTSDNESSFEQAFVLTVNDVNQAPTAIALSNTTLDEGSVGAVVAGITVTDPNAGDTHVLSLASGDGTNDANNDLFAISGSDLVLIGDVEFNNSPTLNILISADDGSESFEQAFELTVNQVLGFEDEISNTLGVYPNPGNDRLEINLENALRGNLSIKISDLTGKIIHSYSSEKIAEKWVDRLDMTSAMPGIYLVEISIEDQHFIQRWIKSK